MADGQRVIPERFWCWCNWNFTWWKIQCNNFQIERRLFWTFHLDELPFFSPDSNMCKTMREDILFGLTSNRMHSFVWRNKINSAKTMCMQTICFVSFAICAANGKKAAHWQRKEGIRSWSSPSFWCVFDQIMNEMCKRMPKHLINV